MSAGPLATVLDSLVVLIFVSDLSLVIISRLRNTTIETSKPPAMSNKELHER